MQESKIKCQCYDLLEVSNAAWKSYISLCKNVSGKQRVLLYTSSDISLFPYEILIHALLFFCLTYFLYQLELLFNDYLKACYYLHLPYNLLEK